LAKYIDTGSNDSSHSLGHWLNTNLIPGILEFHAQFAYFTYSALHSYSYTLRDAVLDGYPVHIVLGSNERSLVANDLRQVLRITENHPNASLTVIAYSNAKFHPKTIQLVRSDGSAVVVVGSGNFTHRGLGLNVEAGIVLDTAEGDDIGVITQIASAIDRWHSLTESGVFPIHNETDISALLSTGIISSTLPPRQPSTTSTANSTRNSQILGSRQRLWTPPASAPNVSVPTNAAAPTVVRPVTAARTAISNVTIPTIILPPQKWYKLLKASDAQQNAGHKIAQLRLTKSVFAIDFRRFFRYDLFGALAWTVGTKNIHTYEYAEANFDVQLPGKSMGTQQLQLHYAPHQEQSQNNYTSVLYWNEALKQALANFSYVGYWVVIERDTQGRFSLTIQANRP